MDSSNLRHDNEFKIKNDSCDNYFKNISLFVGFIDIVIDGSVIALITFSFKWKQNLDNQWRVTNSSVQKTRQSHCIADDCRAFS